MESTDQEISGIDKRTPPTVRKAWPAAFFMWMRFGLRCRPSGVPCLNGYGFVSQKFYIACSAHSTKR